MTKKQVGEKMVYLVYACRSLTEIRTGSQEGLKPGGRNDGEAHHLVPSLPCSLAHALISYAGRDHLPKKWTHPQLLGSPYYNN